MFSGWDSRSLAPVLCQHAASHRDAILHAASEAGTVTPAQRSAGLLAYQLHAAQHHTGKRGPSQGWADAAAYHCPGYCYAYMQKQYVLRARTAFERIKSICTENKEIHRHVQRLLVEKEGRVRAVSIGGGPGCCLLGLQCFLEVGCQDYTFCHTHFVWMSRPVPIHPHHRPLLLLLVVGPS